MRIPDAYFDAGLGQRIPRLRAGATPDPSGGIAIGQAGQNLGNAIMGIATHELEEQGRQEYSAALERKQERERRQREQDAEIKRLERAKQKGEATAALFEHENSLAESVKILEQDRKLSPEEKREQFGILADQTKANLLKSIPEEYQYEFGPTFDHQRFRAVESLNKVIESDIKGEAKARLYDALEALERSPKSLQEKLVLLRDIPEEVWDGAGVAPEVRAKEIQTRAEKITRAEVDGRFNTQPPKKIIADLRAVDAQGRHTNFGDLDPTTREAYIHTAKSRIEAQQREEEDRRRHAQTERNRIAKEAYDEYKEARQGLMALSPKREAELWRQMGGTDYAARAKEVRKATSGLDFMAAKINKDPLRFGAAQMGIEIPPLDAANPQSWGGQLQARGEVAQKIKQTHRLPYLPIFTNDEAKAVGNYLKGQAPQGVVATVQSLQTVLGRKTTSRVAAQFAAADPELGMVVGLVANGKDKAAYHVANGQKLVQEKIQPPKVLDDAIGRRFDGQLGGALTGMPQLRSGFLSAVRSAYVSMAAQNGALGDSLDGKVFDQAFREVVGNTTKINGKRVILPTGVDEHFFKNSFRAVSGDLVKRSGGVMGYKSPETAAEAIKDDAKLYEAGNGRYRFAIDGRWLMTADGSRPFELELGVHDGAW